MSAPDLYTFKSQLVMHLPECGTLVFAGQWDAINICGTVGKYTIVVSLVPRPFKRPGNEAR